jgi:hypothetical protein
MYKGFSTATTAIFGQKQALMLHLFTTTNNALQSKLGQALCMTLELGLTCYPDGSVHSFTVYLWRENYQKCLALRRNMWFQHNRAVAHFAH